MRLFTFLAFLLFVSVSNAAQHYMEIELPTIKHANYERPYVAAWIASSDNQTEKVLFLWKEEDRWVRELKYFWRRIARKQPDAIDGVTGATRGPGVYRLRWDSDTIDIIGNGQHKLCAEVAREHGGRTAKCLEFELPLTETRQLKLDDGEFTLLSLEAKP